MTDMSDLSAGQRASQTVGQGLARRHRKEKLLKGAGMAAILFAGLMLFTLLASLVSTGYLAFTQTHLELDVYIDPAMVEEDNLTRGDYDDMIEAALVEAIGGSATESPREAARIASNGAQFELRDLVVSNPSLVGETVTISVPASDTYDQLAKGQIDPDAPAERRRLNDQQIGWFQTLEQSGAISQPINWALITNPDSRFPELAGLRGAIIGSFWVLLICGAISFPLGIGAAIYLEEFAPRNRISDIIEVNINNLAAVPSVVFGLLALAVFIGWFGMPRSAPIVGGLTLALMTLPTIIIATRASLKAVPPSIREAALGIGASKQQVVFHHVLPLAMPGILTGTIIGLAQALGETAPLLLIGMNAFITSAPSGPFDASTALPTQIFIWSDSPERGFVSRTSAAILVLLAFLLMMNAIAIFLRQRFARSW